MNKKTEFFTIDELSEYLRIPKATLYKFTMDKKIPFFKIGVRLRFKRESIDKWVTKLEHINTK